ncbi:MAG: hypothetical protein U1E76_08575 [Planctomycetota bacterium]
MIDQQPRKSRSFLIGIGLDGADGHVRITRGPGFGLLGGSQETHEMMQAKALRIHEALEQRRQSLADMDPDALASLIQELEP